MGGSAVEETKIQILSEMAETGAMYEEVLAAKYRLNPNDPSNEIVRAVVAKLMREDERSFVRQMLIRVMGREGGFDQAEYLSLFLDSAGKPYFECPSRVRIVYGDKEHIFDSDERVREAAIEAIGKIFSKAVMQKGVSPLDGRFGSAIVKCALLDHSAKVRAVAAELIWKHADKDVISELLKEFSGAEADGNPLVYACDEDALKMAVEVMGNARVRGTAVGPLMCAALENGKAADLAFEVVVRLAEMDKEVLDLAKTKRKSIIADKEITGEEKARKLRRINSLIDRIKIVCRVEEELPVPRQMKEIPGVKPTRNMRPVPAARREDDELIHVPGDPIGNWIRRRRHRKAQELLKKEREAPQGQKIKK
jgi:hypothetical protein